jgi:PAS domain-containing protein
METGKLFFSYPDIFEHYLDQVSQVAVLVLDLEKKILNCNQGFLRFLGLPEKPMGKSIYDFLAPENQKTLVFPNPLPVKPPLRGASFGMVTFQEEKLILVDVQQKPRPLNCCLVNLGQHFVLIGEK